jgi:DNA-binding NarL/FixJ family response regulator
LEAVQKAQELKPDLILLDIGLPNLNGIEAAKRIRQAASGLRIIFLTQNSDKDVVRAALNTGAQRYVLKVDAGSELLTAVAGVLGGDDFVSVAELMGPTRAKTRRRKTPHHSFTARPAESPTKRRSSPSGIEHSVKPQFKQTKSCGNAITVPLARASSPPGKWIQISLGNRV